MGRLTRSIPTKSAPHERREAVGEPKMKTKQGHEAGSKEHAQAIQTAIAGRNRLVHGKFLYGCAKCKHIEPIYLGVGVEGPGELRDEGLYIPSPFGGPPCESCGGETQHVFFGNDEYFPPTQAKPGTRCFIVPETGIKMRFFMSSGFCGATIRARTKP